MNYFLGIPVNLPTLLSRFREIHDPKAHVLEPHITVVSPFNEKDYNSNLDNYINVTVSNTEQFDVDADNYFITHDGHVFYTFDNAGAIKLKNLHDKLYENSQLQAYLSLKYDFLPHITIGKKDSYTMAMQLEEELKKICLKQTIHVSCLRLYKIPGHAQRRVAIKDFKLN